MLALVPLPRGRANGDPIDQVDYALPEPNANNYRTRAAQFRRSAGLGSTFLEAVDTRFSASPAMALTAKYDRGVSSLRSQAPARRVSYGYQEQGML